jgi:ribonuclease P protein subunit RPR2
MSKNNSGKDKEKKLALEHITELFGEAEKASGTDSSLSDKYVAKARDIQMKFRIRMPTEFKRKFCKICHKYFIPQVNSRVRISDGKVVILCFSCKNFTRIPVKPKN